MWQARLDVILTSPEGSRDTPAGWGSEDRLNI
jgi:hypothetical protein